MTKIDEEKIDHLLSRGVENIYPNKAFLEKLLKSGKKLTIYQGIDPTGILHIGHSIPLRKLKEFQELGHKIVVLIGDFTGMIGDPTDKSATRVRLTPEQIRENMKDYKKLISKIIKFDGSNPAEFRLNSKWLSKLTFSDVVEIASNFTVQQMIVRDMFDKRIKEGKPVHLHEFLYPLMQAYDSVYMDVDGEVGGNDQTFNMLAGRDLIKAVKDKEKFVITTRLLTDPTGKKMGKTEGNIIPLADSAIDMFGKVMSWSDDLIIPGLEILTNVSNNSITSFANALKKGENPRNIKFKLAEEVVRMFHGDEAMLEAGEAFNKQFRDREKPKDIPEFKMVGKNHSVVEILFNSGLVSSKGEARRLIEQGGVKIDDAKVTDPAAIIGVYTGMVIQVGKLKFIKIKSI